MKQVLRMLTDGGSLGKRSVYISRVTRTRVVVVNNEVCETYYDRGSGYGIPRGRFGFYLRGLGNLEEWLKVNGKDKGGVKVWDSGFKLRVNSSGDIINPSVPKLDLSQSYMEWFKQMGFEIMDLT